MRQTLRDGRLPGIRQGTLTRSAVLATANITALLVTFDSVAGDPFGMAKADLTGFVAPFTGLFNIYATIVWPSNAVNARYTQILVNGASVGANEVAPAGTGAGDVTIVPLTLVDYYLRAGDVVALNAYQSSGGALNITSASLRVSLVRAL